MKVQSEGKRIVKTIQLIDMGKILEKCQNFALLGLVAP
jgi:hypothetical protein